MQYIPPKVPGRFDIRPDTKFDIRPDIWSVPTLNALIAAGSFSVVATVDADCSLKTANTA